ncbi:hypothetical protein, partial [Mesorhizobium retamae]
MLTDLREEEKVGLIRHRRGGGRLRRNSFRQLERTKLSFGNNARRWEEDATGTVSVVGLREEEEADLFVIAGEEVG